MNDALLTVLIAMIGGAIRVSTPFVFVALGECLTEKSGRINLGNEGVLVLGAMTAYAASYHTGSPWLGVLVAASCGGLLGGLHAGLCSLTRINDIAYRQSFFERLIGAGDLLVESAGERGQEVLRMVPRPVRVQQAIHQQMADAGSDKTRYQT